MSNTIQHTAATLPIKNDLLNGKGKKTYSDGTVYDGDWKDGKRHGKGIMTYVGGDHYAGEFKDGKPCGKGTATFQNGSVYHGDWTNGYVHGRGTTTYSNGNKYNGDWVNGLRHGKGMMTYSNGNKYDGDWVNGLCHGKGVMTAYTGRTYDGAWMNDKCHGKGKLTLQAGHICEGEFSELSTDNFNRVFKVTYPCGKITEIANINGFVGIPISESDAVSSQINPLVTSSPSKANKRKAAEEVEVLAKSDGALPTRVKLEVVDAVEAVLAMSSNN